jgi:hypothetical protein
MSMEFHGQLSRMTAVNPPLSRYHTSGRFGRLFPTLPPFAADTPDVRARLKDMGKPGGLMDGGITNPAHPAGLTGGFTFLGQFIDHDITFDPTSDIETQNDPEALANFRTPALELDSVYGSGPGASPHLYDRHTPNNTKKMLLDKNWENDLPRNSQNRALTGDPRNDENLLVNQLHLAFLKFHNHVIDHLQSNACTHENTVFAEAQRIVRWHYQWIVLHEFLPLIVGQELVDDVLTNKRQCYHWNTEPFIPVEFSVAAYRFGHTMVRGTYSCNDALSAPIFDPQGASNDPNDPNDLRGGVRPSTPENFRRYVEWDRFFKFSQSKQEPQKSARFDTKLATPLFDLQGLEAGSLAARNLERGLAFSLPAGQDVARALKQAVLSPGDLSELAGYGFDTRTPLWYYILREADIGGGKTLGPVGGRIVAEVLIGLLEGDRNSFLCRDPQWKPTELGTGGKFSIADLLLFAGAPLRHTAK